MSTGGGPGDDPDGTPPGSPPHLIGIKVTFMSNLDGSNKELKYSWRGLMRTIKMQTKLLQCWAGRVTRVIKCMQV